MSRSLAIASPVEALGARVELRDACRSYGATEVVHNVSLAIESGEHLALLGANGSGKTTLMMLIAGFETTSRGEVLINGKKMNRDAPHLRDQGFVFHHRPLVPHLTLAQNLAFPLQLRGLRRVTIQSRIARMLERFDLQEVTECVPSELSALQQYYGTLARALVCDPALLLMDEPLGAFDAVSRLELKLEIAQIQRDFKMTIVYATRNAAEAHASASRVALMNNGRITAVIPAQQSA
jgi:putative spermidine/putrescine transport system ATP-binding protein